MTLTKTIMSSVFSPLTVLIFVNWTNLCVKFHFIFALLIDSWIHLLILIGCQLVFLLWPWCCHSEKKFLSRSPAAHSPTCYKFASHLSMHYTDYTNYLRSRQTFLWAIHKFFWKLHYLFITSVFLSYMFVWSTSHGTSGSNPWSWHIARWAMKAGTLLGGRLLTSLYYTLKIKYTLYN